MHALTALLLSLPLAALAGSHDTLAHRRRAAHWQRSTADDVVKRTTTYKLEDDYSGQKLFDGFTFFTDADPTHGTVTYVDKSTAQNAGLAVVEDDGTVKLSVDSTTPLSSGQPRKSVRIQSAKTYNSGLFIGDFNAMPHGCAVWPAYWTVGTSGNWPDSGELDLIEGVNLNTNNQITGHTGATCTLSNVDNVVSHLVNNVCTSSADNNAGCAYTPPGNNTYGHNFNMAGGGVYAHLWDGAGIKVWFFSRNEIPSDISSGNPDPTSWGTPTALFPNNDSCNTVQHFQDHTIVINTSICGDWAGAAFTGDGCGQSCDDFVADPANFKYAFWSINSVKVYQPS